MLSIKEIIKVLNSYNLKTTNIGPSIYQNANSIGLSLDIKDSTFGFLTRYFIFNNKNELEEFLKSFFWYKKNHEKWHITLTLDNYEIPNPKIIYTYNDKELNYNDMINLEQNIIEQEKENSEDIERESIYINIEGLTNYLINLKEKKQRTKKEKNDLKIKENELKYELLETLNKYYGKNKSNIKRPVNLDIIANNNDNELLQDNLKNIKQKEISEMNDYLENLIKITKEEELDEKYILNIYSCNVYKYNINILNKQIDFVKRKIESEKNFNIKGSKIHNIDEELKSFLKTEEAPIDIKAFVNNTKNKLKEKYEKINDNKNSYTIISGNLVRMPIIKKVSKVKDDALKTLNKDFDNLSVKKKAHLVLYNSFFKEICDLLIENSNFTLEDIKNHFNIENLYHKLDEISHLEFNSHFLANYFKYLNFQNINTFFNSLIEVTNTIKDTFFNLTNNLKVFCIENKNSKELLSLNPIYTKEAISYIINIPENSKILYIPDKINIDEDTSEMSIISTKNIYLKSKIIDTSDSIIINKYKKINTLDKDNNILITTKLNLIDTYNFNIGLIEGE